MDKGNSTRVTRTRAKSGSTPIAEQTQNTSVVAVEGEMAPNVNGNKDGSGESTTAVEATPTENIAAKPEEVAKEPETPPSDVSVRVTRKRKAADVKAEEDEVKLNATKDVSAVSEPKPDLPADTPNTTIEEHPHNDSTISEDVSMDTSDTKLNNSNDNNATESTNNSINNDLKDIAIGIQTFGKGKRARVPNKRYSDIARFATRNKPDGSPRSSAKASSNKNGEFPDDDLGEILREESEAAEQQQQQFNKDPLLTPLVRKSFSSLSSSTKKGKPTLDLANPAYLKPFKYGWKRELVYRSTYSDGKRNGDIYYYTPSGKKVRSMREVSENLKNRELSLDDFTFFKEPLGLDDPDKEIIRDAKKAGLGSNSQGSFSKKISTPKLMMKKKRSKTPSMGGSGSSPTSGPPAKSPKLVKSSSFKVKVPTKKFKKVKRDVPDLAQSETTALSSNLNLSKKAKIGGKKSTELTRLPSTSSTKQTLRSSDRVAASKSSSSHQMQNHLQNLAYGYKSLFFVFQYLKVQDLLRAGCVCSMWWDMACHPLLWRTVRMKNSQIHSFDGLANALKRHGTVHLDLRKMLLPANQTDDIWPSFTNAIKKVKSLRRIELCRCLASVVEDLARNNHNLEVINAVTIKCETMTLQPLEKLTNLVDLRLKSTSGLTLTSDLSALKELKKLKHLSITSIKDLNKLNIEVIGELVNLEVLDLGECTDFPKCFGPEILSRLVNLEKLRLEKGHGECHTFEILDAVKDLSRLQQLELVNFDIKTGFDKALGACYNINKLLIIPTYVSQSATTNHMVLGGVLRLQKTLSHFVWGVTLELLRVTELFVDQCEQPDKKVASREKGVNSGDSIPVLKPVPLHGIQQPDVPPTSDTPQVEILPLPNLQKLLLQNLPTTRVKILKIPFHATWRQSITDSVN